MRCIIDRKHICDICDICSFCFYQGDCWSISNIDFDDFIILFYDDESYIKISSKSVCMKVPMFDVFKYDLKQLKEKFKTLILFS